jgi:ActR/RegA family two-component response regulator
MCNALEAETALLCPIINQYKKTITMKTQITNLFIVDDDSLMATALEQSLKTRFGTGIQVSTFNDGESCLEKINKETDIVILDYFLEGKNGLEILKSIKVANPKTEVIMLSGNDNIILAIETFRSGAIDYVVKGRGSWNKIIKVVNHIITEPIRIIVREFGVSKFMAVFFLTFITMGVVVASVLQFLK